MGKKEALPMWVDPVTYARLTDIDDAEGTCVFLSINAARTLKQIEAEKERRRVERERSEAERWCEHHWPSKESKTANFCTEHMAEAFVPDCPYHKPEEVEQHYPGHYKCQYRPFAQPSEAGVPQMWGKGVATTEEVASERH